MKLSLKPQHLRRYKEIARLLYRYANRDMVEQFGLAEALAEEDGPVADTSPQPAELANDLEAMGPTFVKLGQVLSTRPDLLPDAYLKALARLQDKVQPFPYEDVEKIVHAELGVRISKAFLEFDPIPIAAASLAQVHRARLRNWREVVVKVQRPDVRKQISEDMEVVDEIVSFLDQYTQFGKRYQLLKIFEEFRRTLLQELDYQREATNLVNLRANLTEFSGLLIPKPIDDYTTRTILTMDYVRGTKITELSRVIRTEIDGRALAHELFRAYLKQVLVDGLFHADPHPGNVLLTDDGRIALLDLGMVGHTSMGMQETLLKLILALSEGNGEEAADLVIRASEKKDDFNAGEFRRRISQLVAQRKDQGLEQMKVGLSLLDVGRAARDNGLFVPSELTLLGKTLLQLDEVGRTLDPEFDPNASIKRNVGELMSQRMRKDL